MTLEKAFSTFASKTARIAGQPLTFLVCVALVVSWAASGPLFGFSQTWQLVINTGTTIITFLMVFLIQNTQNRDGEAVQTKLDELILTSAAENAFVGIEDLTDKELRALHKRCAERAQAHTKLHERLSDEVEKRGRRKTPTKPATRKRAVAKS